MYKNKNTADKCIKFYYVSWFTYLKLLHQLSFLNLHDWKPLLMLLFFFFYLFFVLISEQCPSLSVVFYVKTKTLYIRVLESKSIDYRVRKKENKNKNIPLDQPKLPTWNVLQKAVFKIHWHNMYMVGIFFSCFCFIESRGCLGRKTDNRTHDTPKKTYKNTISLTY